MHRVGALLVSLALCVGMVPTMPVWAEETPPVQTVAADTGDWKVQKWGGSTDITGQVQEGWVVPTENGVTINYEQPMADSEIANCVIYNDAAERYADSELSFDLKMPWRQQADRFQIAILPRFESGALCEGLAIDTSAALQHTAQNGGEKWSGVENKLNKEFGTEETYHFRIVTQENKMTAYLSVNGGEEQELTSFETSTPLEAGTYGFRLWGFQKNVEITNISWKELVKEEKSFLPETEKELPYDEWGVQDISIPVSFKEGDSIGTILNGETALEKEKDYTVDDSQSVIVLKAAYIAAQQSDFELSVHFALGDTASYSLHRKDKTYPISETDFTSISEKDLKESWGILRENEANWELVPGEGLTITTETGDLYTGSNDAKNMFWQNAEGNWMVETEISFEKEPTESWQQAGLAVYQDDDNYFKICYQGNGGKSQISTSYEVGGKDQSGGYTKDLSATNIWLRMSKQGNTYTVSFSQDGQTFTQAKTVDASFENPKLILLANNGVKSQANPVKVTYKNFKEILVSKLSKSMFQIEKENWGAQDLSIPVQFAENAAGDTKDGVAAITNGEAKLQPDKDYTVTENSIELKAEYIAAQKENFRLQIEFEHGSEANVWVMQYQPGEMQEYVWTPEQGIDMWAQMGGNGTFELTEDKDAMRVKGNTVLINTQAPVTQNGEVEIQFDMLVDDGKVVMGPLFRADPEIGSWQACVSLDGAEDWGFKNSAGNQKKIVNIGSNFNGRDGVKDLRMKVRFEDNNMTMFLDDQFVGASEIDANQMQTVLGNMGLFTDNNTDILVTKVIFREVQPFREETGEQKTVSIQKDGLTVRLDEEFPRVVDYQLNGKTLNGSPVRYNYVTVNAIDMPATAKITQTAEDSVTYHVTPDPEQTGVTFDVKFTVKEDNIVEMLLLNIHEPKDELVYSIGLPRQPMISADSSDPDAL